MEITAYGNRAYMKTTDFRKSTAYTKIGYMKTGFMNIAYMKTAYIKIAHMKTAFTKTK